MTTHTGRLTSPSARSARTSARGAVRLQRTGSLVIGLVTVIGLIAFTWPLFVPSHAGANNAHSGDAPWIMVAVLPLLLVAVLSEFSAGGIDAKGVAMLGVLAACGTALRLPSGGTAGFEPVFFLLFPAGYVLGRHFGFLLGALTIFASALFTAGVGPWLPFQMLAAAWMGFGAGLLPDLGGRRSELFAVAGYAALACLVYGLLLDLWFWPFIGGATTLAFQPGASVVHNVTRFLVFHFSTSLGFDVPRAALNATLVLIAGKPVIAAFRRASRRAAFGAQVTLVPVADSASSHAAR